MSSEEELARLRFAQRILERELEHDVIINDDNSVSGMYDLRIGSSETPEIAVECVGAVDQPYTEAWNIGPAKGPLLCSITGDWKIVITKETRVNKIKQHVEGLLQKLEERGISKVCANYQLKRHNTKLFNELESLGITRAYCFRSNGNGEVHIGMPGIRGPINKQGTMVPEWVGEFLHDPQQRDVLEKLDKSEANECHVFILADFRGVPDSIQLYLRNIDRLPVTEPNLPPPVTGIWLVFSFSTQGICWDSAGWKLFEIPKK